MLSALKPELIARLRLISGLVLFTFVTSHLLTHAVGIRSLAALEQALPVFQTVWYWPPLSALLLLAILTHVAIAMRRLYRVRSWRMPIWEAAQLVLGLAIPLLLLGHILETRVTSATLGFTDSYTRVLLLLWPEQALQQTLLVVLVWVHGCIGLHFWLGTRAWYRQATPLLVTVAFMVPAAGLAGFLAAAREASMLDQMPGKAEALVAQAATWPDAAMRVPFERAETIVLAVYAALVVAILIARQIRQLRHAQGTRIFYPDGRSVAIEPGMSVLEASRSAGIPHTSVCGGRGRCSTCRVQIVDGKEHTSEPSEAECAVLRRVKVPEDVRLACQLRPRGNISVLPLIPATAATTPTPFVGQRAQGVEREIVVLFSDIRGFTRLSEGKLPFDVVFLLNQYFQAMGEAIGQAGGHIDKFIGDGIMALFGTETTPETAARQSLEAARAMAHALERLNTSLGSELAEPLRIGIGLHCGPVILGEMGYAKTKSMTAIGDTVNTASRLESANKELKSQLVFSEDVANRAGLDVEDLRTECLPIRGREQTLKVFAVDDARALPALVPVPAAKPRAGLGWFGDRKPTAAA